MSMLDAAFVNSELSKPTSIFGLRLWVVIGIFVGACMVLVLFLLSLCITSRRRRPQTLPKQSKFASVGEFATASSKDIPENVHGAAPDHRPTPQLAQEIQIDLGKAEHRVVFTSSQASGESRGTSAGESASLSGSVGGGVAPEVSHLGWGRWYTLRELEVATNWLADENVIGEGGYGIVYKGVLGDGTCVAVKNLLNNRGQAEREFRGEVEAIGRVRHKNLVRLLGYCVEGAYRMLVYEYLDNGNLEQWLHGDVGEVSPLTWQIRMNIALGTAKGMAYLHEGLEPKVVHRDVKASNILLDQLWNPKVSDFGLAKLLGSERTYVTTRVMGTFGYVAPEYACTGMLNEKSDVYSFGILMMEIISGRNPVDYSRPPGEVNLVDWLKTMVGSRKSEEVVDPKMPEMPASKALKRAILVALRCVDPDAQKRPKMGHVIHMLEADDLLLRDDRQVGKETSHPHHDFHQKNHALGDKHLVKGSSEASESESGKSHEVQANRR
ncbi:probable serine/threonine-protein kinase At1g01540 [Malania oleifera]|uniref:probable serine/threonine-protein kinase At1g01540 n=1 Tax=Malania oleifera TaxID=397392 RepID=UPI0025AE6E43|nr:probable serine/threonine-protein kinase At1g01540 [Malania oleifera]XP_057980657.1 probable serine/threonine-protein kinase At1g01540 [Malania oleifera]